MNSSTVTLRITQTAVLLALLICAQYFSAALGQYVTGSLVNLVLILTLLTAGLLSGILVATLSPVLAFLLGIGPALPPIIPLIMLGNSALVVTWFLLVKFLPKIALTHRYAIAILPAALVKYGLLFLSVTKCLLPALGLPSPQTAALTLAFSYPQLITAILGGILALFLAPPITKVLSKARQ